MLQQTMSSPAPIMSIRVLEVPQQTMSSPAPIMSIRVLEVPQQTMSSPAPIMSIRVLEVPQQTMSSPAPIMILPVQRKLTNLADIPSALSLPSEEQYSKCTYPLCFDFSQCPLSQPFHVFVYNITLGTSLWTVL